MKNKKSINFIHLVQFVRKEARSTNDPSFVRDTLQDNTKGKEQNKSSKVNTPSRSKGTFAIKSEITEVKKPLSADGGSSTGPKTHSTEIS